MKYQDSSDETRALVRSNGFERGYKCRDCGSANVCGDICKLCGSFDIATTAVISFTHLSIGFIDGTAIETISLLGTYCRQDASEALDDLKSKGYDISLVEKYKVKLR